MAHRLHIDNLSTTLGDGERQFTLQTGSWSVASGEVIGLTGPSGTGKTLLLELLGLLRAPDTGTYRAENDDAQNAMSFQFDQFWSAPNAMSLCAEARAGFFGFVPQSGGLLPFLTVSENVAVTQEIAARPDPEWHRYLLAALGLEGVAHLRPGALSIGQRQRVAIARALAHRPFCVIADEPTAALDPENAHNAMKLLIDAAQAGGAATLLSSHDYPALAQFPMRRMTLSATAQTERHVVSTLSEEAPNAAPLPQEAV